MTIRNCNNYGTLYNLYVYAGGIVGCARNIEILNCGNYGKILKKSNGWGQGEIIGHLGNDVTPTNTYDCTILIKDCVINTQNNLSLFTSGYSNGESDIDIYVKNLRIESEYKEWFDNILFRSTISYGNIHIEDVYVDCKVQNANICRLFTDATKADVEIKNVFVNIDCEKKMTFKLYHHIGTDNTCDIDGVIIQDKFSKLYKGNDFSGFGYNNKKGKFVLRGVDSLGAFNAQIDKTWIINRGFKELNVIG
jgi:hypothetical protein